MSQDNQPTNNQWRWNEDPPAIPTPPVPGQQPRWGQWDPQLAAEQEQQAQQDQGQYSQPPAAQFTGYPGATGGAGGGTDSLYNSGQPGIIPLRPLYLSDIFNGAFSAIRQAPGVLVGLVMAIWAAVSVLLALAMHSTFSEFALFMVPPGLSGDSADASSSATELFDLSTQGLLSMLATSLVGQMVTMFLTALCVPAMGYLVRGKRPTAAYVLSVMGQRWKTLVALLGLLLLAYGVYALLFAGAIGGTYLMGSYDDKILGPSIAILLLVSLALIAVGIYLSVRLSFTFSALILEEIGLLAAIKRSWQLTRGMFWRIFGITLLASLLIQVFIGAISGVVVVILTLLSLGGLSQSASMSVSFALTMLTSGFAIPFTVAISCLLYIDARIRREGLAIALQREASQG